MPLGLVIGAAGGVGRAVAAELLGKGFEVVGTILDDAQDTVLKSDFSGRISTIQLDLSQADKARERLADFIQAAPVKPDVVIMCSGVAPFGPVETMSLSDLRATLEINMVACVAVYQACVPALRETAGRLIFLSSMAGRIGLPFMGQYSASKFALEGVAEVMRREAYRWGVRVSLVEPGGIRTTMMTDEIAKVRAVIADLAPEERTREGAIYEQFLARMEASLPNALEPAEVARCVMGIVTAEDPPMRCEIGADAIRLCAIAHDQGSDALDVALRSAYNGVLG